MALNFDPKRLEIYKQQRLFKELEDVDTEQEKKQKTEKSSVVMAKTEANLKRLSGKSIAKDKLQYPIGVLLSPAREIERILIIL